MSMRPSFFPHMFAGLHGIKEQIAYIASASINELMRISGSNPSCSVRLVFGSKAKQTIGHSISGYASPRAHGWLDDHHRRLSQNS